MQLVFFKKVFVTSRHFRLCTVCCFGTCETVGQIVFVLYVCSTRFSALCSIKDSSSATIDSSISFQLTVARYYWVRIFFVFWQGTVLWYFAAICCPYLCNVYWVVQKGKPQLCKFVLSLSVQEKQALSIINKAVFL